MTTTVDGFTADRMLEIENGTVVDGNIDGDDLVLLTRGGTEIVAGNVRGAQGLVGAGAGITPESHGAVGDNATDDTAALQAAIDEAASTGMAVFLSEMYLCEDTLTVTSSNVVIVAHSWAAGIHYTGDTTALRLGSKTLGSSITGIRLDNLRVTGEADAFIGVHMVGVQFSRVGNLRIDGFSGVGATGLVMDTQSVGSFVSTNNMVFLGGYITGCYNGIKMVKDALDSGTDGCNHNAFYGTRIAQFTGTGVNVANGENNSFHGVDSSTTENGAVGFRIDDDVNGLYQVRTDNSFGVGNNAVGILLGANARDHVIINPTGNGPTEMIKYENPAVTPVGLIFRDGFNSWIGNVRRSKLATGSDKWIARAWKNAGASSINAGDVGYFDSTCGEGEVKRSAQVNHPNPMIAVESVTAGNTGGFAEPGSVVSVNCDAAAVAVGDTLVCSLTVNGRARANNGEGNPRFMLGYARTSKAAGSNGTVKAYIR